MMGNGVWGHKCQKRELSVLLMKDECGGDEEFETEDSGGSEEIWQI